MISPRNTPGNGFQGRRAEDLQDGRRPGPLDLPTEVASCVGYVAALGGTVTISREDSVGIQLDDGMQMVFHRGAGYRAPTWPSPEVGMQMHLELLADAPDAAVARLCALGTTRLDHEPEAHTG
ncbi:hypothetical protein GCM10009836_17960 [Pseudonocardia ailaonensis]|uniref:Glyoxalase-like domain-containing protein n=1 Tax=Pseudonocardia ailaonensis TaxID=367279 RepID=A0ABN2MUV6_9PSEU